MLRRWLAVLRAQQDDPARPADPLVVRVRLDSPGSSFGPRTGRPGNRLGRADTRRGRERRRRARGRGPGRLRRCRPRRRPLRRAGPDPPDSSFPPPTPTPSPTPTSQAPGSSPTRETNHDTRIATVSFRFRDVLIRSRALERLVEAYARRRRRPPPWNRRCCSNSSDPHGPWTTPSPTRSAMGFTAPPPPSPRGRGVPPRRRFRGHARRGGGEREARGEAEPAGASRGPPSPP